MGFPFLLAWLWGAAAAAPLAFAENGGVQAASGFAGTRNATRSSRAFVTPKHGAGGSRETASAVMGGSRLPRAEGKSPLSGGRAGGRDRLPPAGGNSA